jgi:hypothetical protein
MASENRYETRRGSFAGLRHPNAEHGEVARSDLDNIERQIARSAAHMRMLRTSCGKNDEVAIGRLYQLKRAEV